MGKDNPHGLRPESLALFRSLTDQRTHVIFEDQNAVL